MKIPSAALRWSTCVAPFVLLVACAQAPVVKTPEPMGLMDITERLAERALLNGLRAYDDGQYADAEKQLNEALRAGLVSPKDRAAAQKHLAFVYCTSRRESLCEMAFRAARSAYPAFALSKSEAGHPVWGPVYKRLN
jgi:Tfp pilus assembly protein PilF